MESQEWGYRRDGQTIYDCNKCGFDDELKRMHGCPKIGYGEKASDQCAFSTCPGAGLTSPLVEPVFDILRQIENCPLIALDNQSNLYYEIAKFSRQLDVRRHLRETKP